MIALNLLNFSSPFGSSLSGFHVSMFAVGSLFVVSVLLLYYNKIPKSPPQKNNLNSSIYQSRDVLLQDRNFDANYLGVRETTSKWLKTLVYITIVLLIIFPLDIV
jgi:hypothetical protein